MVKYLELIKEDLRDKKFPVELMKDQGYLLLCILDIDVVLAGTRLSYVLNVPLVDSSVYTLYKIWPLPAEYDQAKKLFAYIEPERSYLLIDEAKRLYALLSRDQMHCKAVTMRRQICKQRFVLTSTYDHERCEARMLQPIREVPKDCNLKYVILNESIWTQIQDNEWLYVAPKDEGLTILCDGLPPNDLIIRGTGKLTFTSQCKGYGAQVMLQADHVISTNVSKSDIVPTVNLDIDCCIIEDEKKEVTSIPVVLPLEHTVRHLDDLKIASHKVKELQGEILYQQRTTFRRWSKGI